ncbi:hypothetical protein EV657_11422 [Rhodovulum visakhapatnamense]|uniref:Uncharacterized protein n=1 Tax=Rhodovulum visakhapatnamense TaxID=364297 RepID=A0A4R8FVZ1_9RHOB|nr:hypothetical protein EV657_11422 [Rhodovulum visakhapatnamense]
MANPTSSHPRPVSPKGDSARPLPEPTKGAVFKDWASI